MAVKIPIITRWQHRRLHAILEAEITHLKACQHRLGTIHPDLFKAGMETLGREREFAIWACTPAPHLNWRSPLIVARTKAGRAKVIHLLGAIEHGVFL